MTGTVVIIGEIGQIAATGPAGGVIVIALYYNDGATEWRGRPDLDPFAEQVFNEMNKHGNGYFLCAVEHVHEARALLKPAKTLQEDSKK